MALEYFPCYHSYARRFAKLPDADVGAIIKALLKYSEFGEKTEFEGNLALEIIYDLIADDIDRSHRHYEEVCRSRAENAKKGGRPRKEIAHEEETEKPKKPNGFSENQKNQMVFSETKRTQSKSKSKSKSKSNSNSNSNSNISSFTNVQEDIYPPNPPEGGIPPNLQPPEEKDGEEAKNVEKKQKATRKQCEKKPYGEFQNVLLTDEEYQKLSDKLQDELPRWIEQMSSYLESKGAKYKSHYATILNWTRRAEAETSQRKGVQNRNTRQMTPAQRKASDNWNPDDPFAAWRD